jgi:phosphoribosylanthranilate isomerase
MIEIKICGMTNRDDIMDALELGADYVGFVLYDKSPRGISAREMRLILDSIDVPLKAVGVFVNESRRNVETVADDCGLHAVQLNGDEQAGDFVDLAVPVWRVVRLRGQECSPDPATFRAARYVVDAAVPGMYGGTGVTADWEAAEKLAAGRPVMLAGGLTPDNVAEAVRAVKPTGVDAASGVEAEPGRKDMDKVREFIRNAGR